MKEKPVYFKTGAYSNAADYIVNALIVKKIAEEHGFDGVKKLLTCGKVTKENDSYFTVLNSLTGINRKNYNKKVWELIRKEG